MIETLITEVQKRVQNFEVLKDKLTIFTFDKITAQNIQLHLIHQKISSFHFQVKTFEELIDFFLKEDKDYKNQNRLFYLLKIKEFLQKEPNYEFSSKVSLKLAQTIYENLKKQIYSDLLHFPQLKSYLKREKLLSLEQLICLKISKITKEEIEHLRFNYGETFIFWIDKTEHQLKDIFYFLDKNFKTMYFFPLEQEFQIPKQVNGRKFLDIEKEIFQVYYLISTKYRSISPEKIQIILPLEESFFYLNAFNNLFKKGEKLSFFYSRNNQLRVNSYITTVLSFLEVCSSNLDYTTIFSLFYSSCFQPHFLMNFQPELWNEILTKIPVEQFLDVKHRKKKGIRDTHYGTWMYSLKQLVLNFTKEENFFFNSQEKKEIDNLLLGIFSFLQDIFFFQNHTLTFVERTHLFQTLLTTYLSTIPKTIQVQDIDKRILKENQFAKDIIFSILNRFKEMPNSILNKKVNSQDWIKLFSNEVHFFFQELNSNMNLQGNIFIGHIQDNLSMKYDLTFFCGFDELNYTLDDQFYFEQKIINSKEVYFTYTFLDKNSEPVLPSNLAYILDSIRWVEDSEKIYQEVENISQKEKALFRNVIPRWEENSNFPSLKGKTLENLDRNRLKNQFVKSKFPLQNQTAIKTGESINLKEIIKYIQCPHQFELYKNFSLKTEKEWFEKENFINSLNETLFYRKFITAVVKKKLKKEQIEIFLEKEIFNEANLSTQKIPTGVLKEVLCEEWKRQLTPFYHLLKDNLTFSDCELDLKFENLQFESKNELKGFSFSYKVDIFEKTEKTIKIYKVKRSSLNRILDAIELSIFSYLIKKSFPNFQFELYMIVFKENKILLLPNNYHILNMVYKILNWFLVENHFFVFPFTEKFCQYCSLSNVCFGPNFEFEVNKEYNICISDLKKAMSLT